MKISAKGRYALAAMISMSQNYNNGEYITVISISEKLGISKIYLEQVFSLLKRAQLVASTKGAQGGYQLTRMPEQITALDVLAAVELSLFETTEQTIKEKSPALETAMQLSVFEKLDHSLKNTLEKITLQDLVTATKKHTDSQDVMYFI